MHDHGFVLDHLYDIKQKILVERLPEQKTGREKYMESAFQKALNKFVKDFGYGDAIMHLADSGFTLSQIKERIGKHLPDEYLCEKMIKSYENHGKLLLAEPGSALREKVSMVKDVGEFGQVSFRQVREIIEEPQIRFNPYVWTEEDWKESVFAGHLRELEERWHRFPDKIYASFYVTKRKLSGWEDILSEKQIDFLQCFSYLNQETYLLMDERVWGILKTLLENQIYQGSIYLLPDGIRWIIGESRRNV